MFFIISIVVTQNPQKRVQQDWKKKKENKEKKEKRIIELIIKIIVVTLEREEKWEEPYH